MSRREKSEMQAIIDAIRDDVESELRDNVLGMTSNDFAREYGISGNTAAAILRGLGLKYDGTFWYRPDGVEGESKNE